MCSNIYSIKAPLLKEKKPRENVDLLLAEVKKYKQGRFIYPSSLSQKTSIPVKDIYELMDLLVGDVVTPILEIYCPQCQHFTGYHYERVTDIPEEVGCRFCDYEIQNPIESSALIYKKL